jgi:hypothetical protein
VTPSGYPDRRAEPNPGERMGAGWRLVYTDRPQVSGAAEWPAARDNTNNRAEYLARRRALEQYLTHRRSGPNSRESAHRKRPRLFDMRVVMPLWADEVGVSACDDENHQPATAHTGRSPLVLLENCPLGERKRAVNWVRINTGSSLSGGYSR